MIWKMDSENLYFLLEIKNRGKVNARSQNYSIWKSVRKHHPYFNRPPPSAVIEMAVCMLWSLDVLYFSCPLDEWSICLFTLEHVRDNIRPCISVEDFGF